MFFFAKPYWHYCVQSIWRFYWALVLDKIPRSTDIAAVGALYYVTNDFLSAAKKLVADLKKDWPIDEKAIKKERFPIKPKQLVEPETLKFLRFAATDLVDLYLKDELPMVCLAHHRVHWSECPECRTLGEKAGEELGLEGEE